MYKVLQQVYLSTLYITKVGNNWRRRKALNLIKMDCIIMIIAGDYATLVSRRPSVDMSQGKSKSSDKEKSEESDIQAGKLSVFIHKREDQLSHEVIQPLLG